MPIFLKTPFLLRLFPFLFPALSVARSCHLSAADPAPSDLQLPLQRAGWGVGGLWHVCVGGCSTWSSFGLSCKMAAASGGLSRVFARNEDVWGSAWLGWAAPKHRSPDYLGCSRGLTAPLPGWGGWEGIHLKSPHRSPAYPTSPGPSQWELVAEWPIISAVCLP